jgi:hypothetical protein
VNTEQGMTNDEGQSVRYSEFFVQYSIFTLSSLFDIRYSFKFLSEFFNLYIIIRFMKSIIFTLFFLFAPFLLFAQHAVTGSWNLSIEQQNRTAPGWLEIKRSGRSALVGRYVGSSGSARPISNISYDESRDRYTFSIPPQWERAENDLNVEFTLQDDETLSGSTTLDGNRVEWTAKRAPLLTRESPPRWGEPVNILDDEMSKWVIPSNNQFRMKDGILVNEDVGGNLVTKETYHDLKIRTEFRYPEGSNSGIYLRGRYEIQIADNYGALPDSHINGGIYGFIAPSVNATKKPGEWQTMDVTLVGRTVTVVLNGKEVISNRPIPGITGGALDSDEGAPGPLMIQGDHGPIEFRTFIVTPAAHP